MFSSVPALFTYLWFDQTMCAMNTVFEYKKKLPHTPHSRGTQESHIIDAAREYVLQFLSMEELNEIFGGYIACFDERENSENQRYLGVWGKDKTGKFKRILRERGAEFEVCKISGEDRRISITAQDSSANAK